MSGVKLPLEPYSEVNADDYKSLATTEFSQKLEAMASSHGKAKLVADLVGMQVDDVISKEDVNLLKSCREKLVTGLLARTLSSKGFEAVKAQPKGSPAHSKLVGILSSPLVLIREHQLDVPKALRDKANDFIGR